MTQTFTAVYEPAEEGGYAAFVEEVPGAISQGETLEEARENLKEALELMLADANAVVGEIPNTNGVHGIAIVPELGRGFTSNGRDNNVTIFDLKTLKVISQIKTGTNPDAIIYDPASRRVL